VTIARLRSMIGFAARSRRLYFGALAILLCVLAILSAVGIEMTTVGKFWTDHFDPFAGMAVLIVAVAIWFGEIRQDWYDSLPCRLTVVFQHGDEGAVREVMRCERAGLSSVGEMRALGQQIGAQMVGERTLDFCAPSVEYHGGDIDDKRDGAVYRHYTVVLRLRKLPAAIADLPSDEVLVWRAPFDGEPTRERYLQGDRLG